jgi:DNA-binding NarL/FixJ family response regulator
MMIAPRATPRPPSRAQLEVLAQYVEGGLTIPGVAAARGVSQGTVEQQLHQCRRRLDAATNAQAYAIAIQNGLIRAVRPPS